MKISETYDEAAVASLGQLSPDMAKAATSWPVWPTSLQQLATTAKLAPSSAAPLPPVPQQLQAKAAPVVTSTALVTPEFDFAKPKVTVTPGLRHDIVRSIQAKFNDLGLGPLDVDGIYGPKTEAAAKRFHEAAEVPFSGTIHADTAAALVRIPKGTMLKAEVLLPFLLTSAKFEAWKARKAQGSTPEVQGSTPEVQGSTPGFDFAKWLEANWKWLAAGAAGVLVLGYLMTRRTPALAGVEEVESLGLDELDLGDPLPPPRRKKRKAKRKTARKAKR